MYNDENAAERFRSLEEGFEWRRRPGTRLRVVVEPGLQVERELALEPEGDECPSGFGIF